MLESASTHAMIAVSDLDVAKEFYGGKLGLRRADDRPGAAVRYATAAGTCSWSTNRGSRGLRRAPA
jgi:catechol 2,3-dioxygenase-like lactoylglutathione lyase family enzyme